MNVTFIDESKKAIEIVTYKKFRKTGVFIMSSSRNISLRVFKVEYQSFEGYKSHYWQLCLCNDNSNQWFAIKESIFRHSIISKAEKLKLILGYKLETGHTKEMARGWHNDSQRRSI